LPENQGCPDHESTPETTNEPGPLGIDADHSAVSSESGGNNHHLISSDGKLDVLPHWLSEQLHLLEDVEIIDPRFLRHSHIYLSQAFLATLTILLFVDSLADATLAAALGSSIVILFVHPSASAARARSVIGGHTLALLIGVGVSLLISNSPTGEFIVQNWLFPTPLWRFP